MSDNMLQKNETQTQNCLFPPASSFQLGVRALVPFISFLSGVALFLATLFLVLVEEKRTREIVLFLSVDRV
jgi:hypothetical protein